MPNPPQIDFTKYAQAPPPQIDFSKYAAPSQPTNQDTGVMAGLERVGSGIIHAPGAIWDAFTKPSQNDGEKISATLLAEHYGIPQSVALGLHRLIISPMVQQGELADAYEHIHKSLPADQQAKEKEFFNTDSNFHKANMHRIASMVPIIGPMAEDITQRYLEGDKSGAVTELLANIAAPKAIEGAGNAALAAIRKVAPAAAERMYQSALKPRTTIPVAQREAITQTGLSSGIAISEKGATKLSGLIDDLNQKITAQIQSGAKAGQTIDPANVAARADQIKSRFANQVNPTSDLQAIEASKQEFLANNPNPIPVDEAQTMKQGTYQQLKGRAYGELKSATVEAQKALARGIKEELQVQFPEIKGLNAQEARLIGLDDVLERALNRIGNHQLIGIGTPIVAGAVGGTLGAGTGIVSGIFKALLDDPIVKSKLAIALNKGGKLPPAVATARLNQFINSLGQSQTTGEQR